MRLNELSPPAGSRSSRKRRGRGNGSGHGTYSCRGLKGQNSRSGGGTRPGFEGGQMPIQRRLPKRGFKNIFKKKYAIVNLRDLSKFETGVVVDEVALIREGIISGRRDGIKLLSLGEINYALTVRVNKASKSARAKLEAAGGKVEVI